MSGTQVLIIIQMHKLCDSWISNGKEKVLEEIIPKTSIRGKFKDL